MLVYKELKSQFLEDVDHGHITENIETAYEKHFGKSPESQVRSWQNSMVFMYNVLEKVKVPNDAGIAIEFNIPMTSKRIDFIISGYGKDGNESAIIIELKQWDKCEKIEDKDGLVRAYTGHAIREVSHPSYQAWSYQSVLESFSQTVQDDHIELYPCAYLHNYNLKKDPDIIDPMYDEYIKKAPVFCLEDKQKLIDFIDQYIVTGDHGKTLLDISDGKIRPSRMLQDSLESMLNGNQDFIMIDDQKVVYEEAKKLSRECSKDHQKRMLIVQGGPGTGKTVVAINLLVTLTKEHKLVNYVTKNSAPRNVYFKLLKGKHTDLSPKFLFQGSGKYTSAPKNQFDVLIADEAHRLNMKSGLYQNLGENQIKEIINASLLSIFFIDEEQRVTLQDIGSVKEIEEQAKLQNAEICTMKLESQFRCNGSDGYLAWIDQLLEIRPTANVIMDLDYDFKVFDDPNKLREAIRQKNDRNKARLVAGYCWEWKTASKNREDIYDINLHDFDFHMSWNLSNTDSWAIDPGSVEQAGCIHTCQGLEFDYVGVIIGDDLRYENGHVITDYTKRAKTDKSLKGIKAMIKTDPEKAEKTADEIIRNTYRTLMTRGMKGCYIYCTDQKLSDYIKSKLQKLIV